MFCLMFLVILFDSHIFFLRHADQTNFVMYIIMPKKYTSIIFQGLFVVLFLGFHWYILDLFPGHCCGRLPFGYLFKLIFFRILGIPSSPGGLPRNLPYLTAHFVGRDVDVDEILTKLQTFRMVVLLSIPGMGKTEVGIRVSHLLKERGDQFVTHIRVKSHQKLINICSEILDRLSSRTYSETDDFMSLAKRKLSERNIPTVIVLDNTENIQGEEFDEFARWLVKSAPNVTLIITTRRHVGFVSEDVFTFRLKPLDPDSSAKLLRSLVDDCSEEHSKELAKLCGGIPLLLLTCADLLNKGFSPEPLIQQLWKNPIQLFRTSANDVYNTLEVFFGNFSNEVKQNLVLFSVFPSGFSAQDIQFFFEDPLHCETVSTMMVNYALLQRDAAGKMRVHPLVQAYFRTEKESLGMGDLWRATQCKFNHNYLGLLRVLSKEFISKDSALVAIHKFGQQKANIMEALKNCLEDSSDLDDKHFVLDLINSTEVLDFVAKVLTPPKEFTALYQRCCDIAEASGDKKRHAESLNSLGAGLKRGKDSLYMFSVDDILLKYIITPGSELLERLALELNREENPEVKNWKHLAWKMKIPADVRRSFADVKLIRKSPTKEVLEWVAAHSTEKALSDVAKTLDEIQRNDTLQKISRHFSDTVDRYSLK